MCFDWLSLVSEKVFETETIISKNFSGGDTGFWKILDHYEKYLVGMWSIYFIFDWILNMRAGKEERLTY